MNSEKQIEIVNPNDSRIILAQLKGEQAFSKSEKKINWKKQLIKQKDVAKNPERLLFKLEDKGQLQNCSKEQMFSYIFTKEEIGNYIKFYAYIENFESIQQCTIFYVEDKCNTNIRIRGVECIDSNSTEIEVRQKIKLKVNEYSIQKNKVPDSVKESIKWMIRVGDNKNERLIIDGVVITGEEIELDILEEWAGKKIIFMPFLNIPTPKVSWQPQVLAKYIQNCYWTNEQKERITFLTKDIQKAFFFVKTIGYKPGETISIKISDEDGADVALGQKEIFIESPIDENGEIWVEAYNNIN